MKFKTFFIQSKLFKISKEKLTSTLLHLDTTINFENTTVTFQGDNPNVNKKNKISNNQPSLILNSTHQKCLKGMIEN